MEAAQENEKEVDHLTCSRRHYQPERLRGANPTEASPVETVETEGNPTFWPKNNKIMEQLKKTLYNISLWPADFLIHPAFVPPPRNLRKLMFWRN